MLALTLGGPCSAAPFIRWGPVQKPTHAEMIAAWPAEAARAGIEGTAAALCEVSRMGAVSGCRVIWERPVGQGFGAALLGLSPKFGLKPVKQLCSEYFHQTIISTDWSKVERSVQWSSAPSSREFGAVFPKEAIRRGVGGAVALSCSINGDGGVAGCNVIYESPPEWGFGAAALSIAPRFGMKPVKGAGQPLPDSVYIPLNFRPYNGVVVNC